MNFYERFMQLTESAESIEVQIYRNRIREDLLKELTQQRSDMADQDRYPYQGEWLTIDEIHLTREGERKRNFSKLVQSFFLLGFLLLANFVMIFFIWRSIR
jgi:hypothetical protein